MSSSVASALSYKAINRILPILEKQILSAIKTNGFPGVAVAIASRDQVYYLKTFGVKRLGKEDKILPTTLFQIASISKPLSATLLAILQKRGVLSFEDPIKRFLPEFQTHSTTKPLKICHILSHSSGVPKEEFNDLIEASIPREVIMTRAQEMPAIAEPGENFSYHNALYGGIVEDVILQATGKPFDQVLIENLLNPLGMKNACVGLQVLLKSKNRAYPHVQNQEGWFAPTQSYSRKYYIFPSAAGVNASLQDLVSFLQLYLGKFPHIISKEHLHQLLIPSVEDTEAISWFGDKKGLIKDPLVGLGWKLMTYAKRKMGYHGGWLKGFRTFLGFLPDDDIGIIVLINSESMYPEQLALEFFDLYLNTFTQK